MIKENSNWMELIVLDSRSVLSKSELQTVDNKEPVFNRLYKNAINRLHSVNISLAGESESQSKILDEK